MSAHAVYAGAVQAGIFDTINGVSLDAKNAIMTVGGVAILAWILFSAFRNGFSLAKLLMAALVGGIVAWLVFSEGIFKIGTDVGDELAVSPASSHVLTYHRV